MGAEETTATAQTFADDQQTDDPTPPDPQQPVSTTTTGDGNTQPDTKFHQ